MPDLLHYEEEPIVALASGQGASAIAILRISGKDCHSLLARCLSKKKPSSPWLMNHQTLSELKDPKTGTVLDEVMVTLFRGPFSYTGQDSAEIFTHGSPYIIQSALKMFYALGFRHADPGEFTRRAYLSGKIDLSEAEGIHGLISSYSHQQWLAARQLYTGKLKTLVDGLSGQLIEAIAWMEASIDFPEEDHTSEIQRQQITDRVRKVYVSLENLLKTYSHGKVATQGLSVALFGEPNVGKSTLMNTLLNSERAIVSDIPGTTRDYLEEPCLINGRLVKLIDTAGVRKHAGVIEKMGIERTFEIAKQSDLVLFLTDSVSENALIKVQTWVKDIQAPNYLIIHTKSDLVENSEVPSDWISISCHSGLGVQTLKNKIQDISDNFIKPLQSDHPVITTLRHKNAVECALKSLDSFFSAVSSGAYDEILAFELHQTAKELRSIIGEVSTEDILDKVFSSFCVGK